MVDVRLDALHAYAQAVYAEYALVRQEAAQIRAVLGDSHGMHGTQETRTFGADGRQPAANEAAYRHAEVAAEALRHLGNLEQGLQATAFAAARICKEYDSTDKLNRLNLATAGDLFTDLHAPRGGGAAHAI